MDFSVLAQKVLDTLPVNEDEGAKLATEKDTIEKKILAAVADNQETVSLGVISHDARFALAKYFTIRTDKGNYVYVFLPKTKIKK